METILHILEELKYGVIGIEGDHVTKSSNIAPVSLKDGEFAACSMMRSDYNDWLLQQMDYYLALGESLKVKVDATLVNPAWYSPTVFPMVAMLKGFYSEALGHDSDIATHQRAGSATPKLKNDYLCNCSSKTI